MTIGAACRFLGDLLSDPALQCEDAEALTLGDAMDRLTPVAPPTPVASPPPTPQATITSTPTQDPPSPLPTGLYAELSAACDALGLIGKQRGLVKAIVAAGKPVPIPDLYLTLELEGSVDSGWGNTVNPLNVKLKAHGLRIKRVNSHATLLKPGGS